MKRVGILGATGYTAFELMKLLLRHPDAEIVLLTSRQEDCPHVSQVHPALTARLDLCLQLADPPEIAAQCDVVFSCLPHAASAEIVKPIVDSGCQVIDFSADYRIRDRDVYEAWYQVTHPDADRIGRVPYGLPELFRESIVGAPLVANPGCFPTSAILPLAPLLSADLIEADGIIIDSKTGVSGGGRTPKLPFHYPECNESISSYGVGGAHRHTPEMDQFLSGAAGKPVEVLFTPHLTPMERGILSTIYATPQTGVSEEQLRDHLAQFYQDMPFVRVVDKPPATRQVSGTNFCDIALCVGRGRVTIMSAIDNLIKGASGAAVQNFNLMCGFEETLALL